MADRSDVLETHRADETREILQGVVPVILIIADRAGVAVTALIIGEYMPDGGERRRQRTIDARERAGSVKDHDRWAVATPIKVVQANRARVDESFSRFTRRHRRRSYGIRIASGTRIAPLISL